MPNTGQVDPDKENEANNFSEQELIPAQKFSAFIADRNFNKASITSFAKSTGIAPGIVVGQLQHKKLLHMTYCNDLKQRFKWTHE